MRTRVVSVLLLLLCAAVPAEAGIGNACEVKETPDGFAAIRAAPNPKGALVAKATPGHIVEVVTLANGKPRASGVWWRVRHFPGEAMPLLGDAAYDKIREGWMNHRLIDGCG